METRPHDLFSAHGIEIPSTVRFHALSLLQPWASAVARGLKRYETRSWETDYRGPLFIHASKTVKPEDRYRYNDLMKVKDNRELPASAIIAIVMLTDCKPTEVIRKQLINGKNNTEYLLGDYSAGRFAWRFEHLIELRWPVPYDGALGIWCPLRARKDGVELLRLRMGLGGDRQLIEPYERIRNQLELCEMQMAYKNVEFPQYKNALK